MACDSKHDDCGFDFGLSNENVFYFSFPCSGDETLSSVSQHAMPREFSGNWETEVF